MTIVAVYNKLGVLLFERRYDSLEIATPIVEFYRSIGFQAFACYPMKNSWG